MLKTLPQYFDAVRENRNVGRTRSAIRNVLRECSEFVRDLHVTHYSTAVEERNIMVNRQKLLGWLEEGLGVLCETLYEIDEPALASFRTSICEGVDSALLALIEAIEMHDDVSWELADRIIGDRRAMMRTVRHHYFDRDPPLSGMEHNSIFLITNAVEEVFFVLSRLKMEFRDPPESEKYVLHA